MSIGTSSHESHLQIDRYWCKSTHHFCSLLVETIPVTRCCDVIGNIADCGILVTRPAPVAQWIEHRIPNPGAVGSIPTGGTSSVIFGINVTVIGKGDSMTDIEGKKLPTVEQVEIIMTEWGKNSVQEFARRLHLEEDVIKATIESLQRLKRMPNVHDTPVLSCYRNDTLDSIVRCAGSRHGYM